MSPRDDKRVSGCERIGIEEWENIGRVKHRSIRDLLGNDITEYASIIGWIFWHVLLVECRRNQAYPRYSAAAMAGATLARLMGRSMVSVPMMREGLERMSLVYASSASTG